MERPATLARALVRVVPRRVPAGLSHTGRSRGGGRRDLVRRRTDAGQIAAGDNPRRLRSEAAFAKLCGVSPVEASSGKVIRHRLNRGGDRHANAALHRIVMVRLRWRREPTIDYLARRTAEGKSKREIVRCLKRYVAREVYRALVDNRAQSLPHLRG
jgi:hypothetical protein